MRFTAAKVMERNFVHCQNVFRIEKANQNVLDAGPIVQPSQAQPSGASLTLILILEQMARPRVREGCAAILKLS